MTDQDLYDVAIRLGLMKSSERDRCPALGKVCKTSNAKTICSVKCQRKWRRQRKTPLAPIRIRHD